MPPADPPRLLQRVEAACVRALVGGVAALPAPAAAALVRLCGDLLHALLRGRVKQARENVAAALDLAPADREAARIVRASVRHLLRVVVEFARLPRELAHARADQILILEERRHLDEARARSPHVVILTAHLGNWEVGASLLPQHGIPIVGFARALKNPLITRYLAERREHYGMLTVDKTSGAMRLLREMREGRIASALIDQHAGSRGLRIPFFGRDASTFTFLAQLAHRQNAPIVPAFTHVGPKPPQVIGRFEPAIDPDPTLPEEEDSFRMMLAFHRALEAAIRRTPEQYLWLHRRWKPTGREPDPRWRERYAPLR
jgi:Kdo2-lipid IVA lauroyltransferase/acyltransferase